jgi:signal transduction histidine kinase
MRRVTERLARVVGPSAGTIYLTGCPGSWQVASAAGEPGDFHRVADRIGAALSAADGRCGLHTAEFTVPPDGTDWHVAAVPVGRTGGRAGGMLAVVKPAAAPTRSDLWFLRELGMLGGLALTSTSRTRKVQELKEYDRAKSRFMALLMHQIGSPLATVACSLQALSRAGDSLSQARREKLITNSLDRIGSVQQLSRRLLDLETIRSGDSLRDIQPVDLSEILRQVSRMHELEEGATDIEITDLGGRATVAADPEGLALIFDNLVDNALKYSPGPKKLVEVVIERDEGCVTTRVRDHGVGIPADKQEAVFEEFTRVHGAQLGDVKGAGLGLAFARELVTSYDGRIALESEVGEGTCVTVEFPALDQ